MKTYRTSQIAEMFGVHPNTIRFYEHMQLLPHVPRTDARYRIFNERHVRQLKLLRTAFRAEIISDRMRQEVYEIVKIAAKNDIDAAEQHARVYLAHIRKEKKKAEESIQIASEIWEKRTITDEGISYKTRREVAQAMEVSVDTLRNWERNGLVTVPTNRFGSREYGSKEINRLKLIRILRNAHYSIMSIRRMLIRLDGGEADARHLIDTPNLDEEIVSAADRYITALTYAEKDALEMLDLLDAIRLILG